MVAALWRRGRFGVVDEQTRTLDVGPWDSKQHALLGQRHPVAAGGVETLPYRPLRLAAVPCASLPLTDAQGHFAAASLPARLSSADRYGARCTVVFCVRSTGGVRARREYSGGTARTPYIHFNFRWVRRRLLHHDTGHSWTPPAICVTRSCHDASARPGARG